MEGPPRVLPSHRAAHLAPEDGSESPSSISHADRMATPPSPIGYATFEYYQRTPTAVAEGLYLGALDALQTPQVGQKFLDLK